jgi:tetratricopeptide (TPR) repeat protein
VAWARARLPHEPGSRARSECVRAALVEALRVRDAEAVEVLVPFLRDRPRADDAALWAACEASPHASVAAVIAEALAACEASVDGLSILAGLREREARTEDAIAAHRRAISHAEGIADAAGSLRASLELARLLALVGRDVDALALATDIERHLETLARLGRAAALAPRDTLILARVELAASGRYQRACAIASRTSSCRAVSRRAPRSGSSADTSSARVCRSPPPRPIGSRRCCRAPTRRACPRRRSA